jgi:3-deoxy-7-phosphoheptulonate synthase
MHTRVDDLRIAQIKPLIPPAILMEDIPLSEAASRHVAGSRRAIEGIMDGKDDRLLVIVGPCSIHDVEAGREYGRRLLELRQRHEAELEIVMRVYFEKPRTRSGWKGLINDPYLDDSFQINKGLHLARQLLVDIVSTGLPAACEFLDTISPQFIADTMSWGAIGARTTESQIHRELASGLSMPVGFKNGTDGNVKIAIDAIFAARGPHHFLSVTKQGLAAIVATKGNEYCHVILRGAASRTNFDAASVEEASKALAAASLPPRLMVDLSHGNSAKDHKKQLLSGADVAGQIAAGSTSVFGVMIESFLEDGNQALVPGKALKYGQSVTDACLGWDATVPLIGQLAEAVRQRRLGA